MHSNLICRCFILRIHRAHSRQVLLPSWTKEHCVLPTTARPFQLITTTCSCSKFQPADALVFAAHSTPTFLTFAPAQSYLQLHWKTHPTATDQLFFITTATAQCSNLQLHRHILPTAACLVFSIMPASAQCSSLQVHWSILPTAARLLSSVMTASAQCSSRPGNIVMTSPKLGLRRQTQQQSPAGKPVPSFLAVSLLAG